MNVKGVVAVIVAAVLLIFLLALAFKSCQEPVGPAPIGPTDPTTEETTDVQPTVIETTTPGPVVVEHEDSTPVVQYSQELPETGGIKI